MTTLIKAGGNEGATRRCDARCYQAQTRGCACVCGGMNHGAGLERALQNTADHAQLLATKSELTLTLPLAAGGAR